MKRKALLLMTISAIMLGAMTARAATPDVATVSFTTNKEDKEIKTARRAYPKISGTGFEMNEWTCSVDPSEWKSGSMVTFRIVLETTGSYRFDPNITKVVTKDKNATITSKDITPTHITFYVDYRPVFQFEAPANVHMDGDKVKWDKVEGASRYEVSFQHEDDEGEPVVDTKTTDSLALNLERYGNVEDVKVRAIAKGNNDSGLASEWKLADDVESTSGPEVEKKQPEQKGKLSTTASGVTTYTHPDKTKATGWIEHESNWYYFDPVSNAAYKFKWLNENGKYYYFDAYGVMMTGQFNDGYNWYYMNADRNSSDYGAMVTGWVQIGDSQYFFNDGSRSDFPLGAMLTDTTTPDGAVVGADGRRKN